MGGLAEKGPLNLEIGLNHAGPFFFNPWAIPGLNYFTGRLFWLSEVSLAR